MEQILLEAAYGLWQLSSLQPHKTRRGLTTRERSPEIFVDAILEMLKADVSAREWQIVHR